MNRKIFLLLIGLTIALIGLAACGTPKTPPIPTPRPFATQLPSAHGGHDVSSPTVEGARMIMMDMREFEFNPKQIRARAGETITLMVINEGTVEHDMKVEALAFHAHAEPHKSVTASLTVKDKGEYKIYCSVAGHQEAGMRGTLLVE